MQIAKTAQPSALMEQAATLQAMAKNLIDAAEQCTAPAPELQIDPTRIYTAEGVSKIMMTSRNQIYAYIRSGKLRTFRLEPNKRKNLIQGSDIQALIDHLKRENVC